MLVFDEPEAALWERFQSGNVTLHEIQSSPLLQRWWRAATAGVRADGPPQPRGAADAELIRRRERFAADCDAASVIAPIAPELVDRGVLVAVADTDGYILHTAGGGSFAERATTAALSEGTCWSESARGTNAIGTALAEGDAVGVIGRAHYERTNHLLFGYGSPLRHPLGQVVGALALSGAVEHHSPLVRLALRSAVTAIESEMRGRMYPGAAPNALAPGPRFLDRLLQRCSTAVLLVEAPGVVRHVNGLAAATFSLRQRAPFPLRRVLPLDWSDLKADALASRRGTIESAVGSMRLELEPLVDPHGDVVSIVVYVEPASTRGASLGVGSPPTAPPPSPAIAPTDAFSKIIGSDAELRAAVQLAARFARSEVPVMILAETGTGKELLAHGIHQASGRARGPFVPVNCGAVAAGLLESELFGHAAGAFTGARSGGYVGKIGAAAGGTLFLDEVAEMSEPLQAALLRTLEDGSYYRVGDNQHRYADIRVICATARDLTTLVQQGKFRQDLFFRINGVSVTLPPLRQRTDRAELARGLLERVAQEDGVSAPALSESAIAWIEAQAWPGNVRELRSALRHALIMAGDSPIIDVQHLPGRAPFPSVDNLGSDPPPASSSAIRAAPPEPASLRDVEAEALDRALAASDGNMSEAARILGVARSTLYRMLRKRERRAE